MRNSSDELKNSKKIIDYYTRKILGYTDNINKWCNTNKYLPHHKTTKAWIVIK